MSATLAIEPPRKTATYVWDDFWSVHTLKCRCCSYEATSPRISEIEALLDTHHGTTHGTVTIGALTTDI